MDDNKLEAKLLKIKALAERGEGGEKEAAIKMYHKLLKKYDIDEKALQKDKLSKHWFTYETDIEENLLVQISLHHLLQDSFAIIKEPFPFQVV